MNVSEERCKLVVDVDDDSSVWKRTLISVSSVSYMFGIQDKGVNM